MSAQSLLTVRGTPRRRFLSVRHDCPRCGEATLVPPNLLRRQKQVFCSRECFIASQRGQARSPRVVLRCEGCGNDYALPPYLARKQRGRFCSQVCYESWARKPLPVRDCEWCGRSYARRQIDKSGRHFCSHRCSHAAIRLEQCGPRVHNWRGGRSSRDDYGPLWRARAKRIVARDRNCVGCGRSDRLTVHHIIPGGDLIALNRRDLLLDGRVLVTLCAWCHSKVTNASNAFGQDEIGNRARAYVLDHPEWFDRTWPPSIEPHWLRGLGLPVASSPNVETRRAARRGPVRRPPPPEAGPEEVGTFTISWTPRRSPYASR